MYHKINGTTIDHAEDLGFNMPMHNLLENHSNYSDRIDKLWFCSKDEAANFNVNIISKNIFKSFKKSIKFSYRWSQ